MTGDNSTSQKTGRAYMRLIVGILNEFPLNVLNDMLAEYNGYCLPNRIMTLEEAQTLSKKYILLAQGGRCFPILKHSPLGKYMYQGKWKQKDE